MFLSLFFFARYERLLKVYTVIPSAVKQVPILELFASVQSSLGKLTTLNKNFPEIVFTGLR